MAVYYGVVHGNHIELEGSARLTEGTRVEVRPQPIEERGADEELVKARLRAAGLLAPAPVDDGADEDDEFEPVIVQGKPLPEQVIRERR